MKAQTQVALLLAAMLYLAWGIALWVAPPQTHALLTAGFYSAGVSALFGAALMALSVLCVLAAAHTLRPMVQAAATALLLVGLTAAYQMFVGHSILTGAATVISLALNLGIGLFLLIAVSDGVFELEGNGARNGRKRTRVTRRMTPRRA